MYQCSLSFLVSMILANKPKHKEKSPCMLRPKTQPVSSVRFDDHAKQRLFHKCDTTILLYNISTFRPGSLRGLCSILGVPRSALFCCSQMLFHGSVGASLPVWGWLPQESLHLLHLLKLKGLKFLGMSSLWLGTPYQVMVIKSPLMVCHHCFLLS